MKEYDVIIKTVAEGLRSIAQGVEKIAEKLEESAPKKQPKAKPARKTKAKPAPKKAPAKKATAADTVLAIINRSKKGVDSATLSEKTGYDKKKIGNIVFKLRKLGKIKSVNKGVYTKA
jgi:predicted Rossmann fold nucleotide-binding protein DprA/Smf involved in DNA uptake